jgi:carbonic anhydrase/acetyltransferase-like protein (isoleucine patch superfamily)
MILTHGGKKPAIDPTAYVAPTATVCGDVTIGAHCRIMFGACLIAEGGSIEIGTHGIVLENAVIRSTSRHSARIGDHCLIGPNAHVAGCTIMDEVFVATGAAIFHGAVLEARSEVRVNGVVHLKTRLPEKAIVPIGWVAVGDPASVLPPDQHDAIWTLQEPLNFPLVVYGYDRAEANMIKITERMSKSLAGHATDQEAWNEKMP